MIVATDPVALVVTDCFYCLIHASQPINHCLNFAKDVLGQHVHASMYA